MEVATARVAGTPWSADGGAVNRLRSDRSLAERFRAGDETAFAALYERYRARVNAICIGVLGSREDALDASQEVFAAVATKLREEPPRELKPWLATVARNAAVDIARRRRPTVEADDDVPSPRSSGSELELQELVSALRELPEQQRTALVMRELGGWSYDEIAASLGVDADAVNGLIARARLGLRAQREAAALVCSAVRESLAAEEDGRRRAAPIRRHLRSCTGCSEFNRALQADARTLRALLPGSALGLIAAIAALRPRATVVGGLGAVKVALTGAGAQIAAVCAVSACTVGGIVALDGLPPLPDPLSPERDESSQGTSAVSAATPAPPADVAPSFTAEVAAGTAGATARARERREPGQADADAPSLAPGPEGRVPADHPVRFVPGRDDRRGPRGRGREPGGPAPFNFGAERGGERFASDFEGPRPGPGPGPGGHRDEGRPDGIRDGEPRRPGGREGPQRTDSPNAGPDPFRDGRHQTTAPIAGDEDGVLRPPPPEPRDAPLPPPPDGGGTFDGGDRHALGPGPGPDADL